VFLKNVCSSHFFFKKKALGKAKIFYSFLEFIIHGFNHNLIIQIAVHVSPRIEYENYAMQHLM